MGWLEGEGGGWVERSGERGGWRGGGWKDRRGRGKTEGTGGVGQEGWDWGGGGWRDRKRRAGGVGGALDCPLSLCVARPLDPRPRRWTWSHWAGGGGGGGRGQSVSLGLCIKSGPR